jgi:hypothetical protein
MKPEAAALLLETNDPELVPNMCQDASGMVTMDICLECHMNMGPDATLNERH